MEAQEEIYRSLRPMYRWEMRLRGSSRRREDLRERAELGDKHHLEELVAIREKLEELGGIYPQILQEEIDLDNITSRLRLRPESATRVGSTRTRSTLPFRAMPARL